MIRRATEEDIPKMHAMIYENYVKVLSNYHSADVLKENMENLTQESFRSQMQVVNMYVVEEEDQIVAAGFYANAGTKEMPDYIMTALFVNVESHSKGLGKQLFKHIVNLLRADKIEKLRVPASINAIPFYERMGFVMDKEQPNISEEINWMTMAL